MCELEVGMGMDAEIEGMQWSSLWELLSSYVRIEEVCERVVRSSGMAYSPVYIIRTRHLRNGNLLSA